MAPFQPAKKYWHAVLATGVPKREALLAVVGYFSLALIQGFSNGIGLTLLVPLFVSGAGGNDTLKAQISAQLPFLNLEHMSPVLIGGVVVVSYLVKVLAQFAGGVSESLITDYTNRRARSYVAQYLFWLPLPEIESMRAGELTHVFSDETGKFSSYIFQSLCVVYRSILLLSYACILLVINSKILLLGVVLGLPFLILIRSLWKKINEKSAEGLSTRIGISSVAAEKISQIRFVKSIGAENVELGVLEKKFSKDLRIAIKLQTLSEIGRSIPPFVTLLALIALALCFKYFPDKGSFILAAILPMSMIGMKAFDVLLTLNQSLLRMKYDRPYSEKILQLILKSKENGFVYKRYSSAVESQVEKPKVESIELVNVTFGYNPEKPILKNFNLKLEKGAPTILRGESGSGKSTIAHLLRGLLKAQSGEIRLNGKTPLSQFEPSLVSSLFGYVTQEPTIIYGTIRDNLIYGYEGRATDATLFSLLAEVELKDFVLESEEGLRTLMAEGGKTLSGGQRQRLSIARVLLRDTPVLIFDEITSSLDPENSQKIYKLIEKISRTKICLMISHDPRLELPGAKLVSLGS